MKSRSYLAVLLLISPLLALAHPGHELQSGLIAGLMHPLTGVDHLAAMLAVGLWAGQLGGHLRWAVPLSFVAVMLSGALLGLSGWQFGVVEQGIAASVCVLGLLLAGAVSLPALACISLSGAFAMFHGYAHGIEAPAAHAASYVGGFALSTVVLHVIGLMIATGLVHRQRSQALRWAGTALAAGGMALFAV